MLEDGQYLTVDEAGCHDGTPYPEEWGDRWAILRDTFHPIRVEWGGPLIVVSGYRTHAYNQRVAGADKSQHPEGRALDIKPGGLTPLNRIRRVVELHELILVLRRAKKLPHLRGLGYYPGKWCHIDTRPADPTRPSYLATWTGQGIGSEQADA